ncbi:hypothetical protein glysoja_043061 [Glycine soja]|uniref:Uncharacterized protein n=1 Tax=Glycine soja TaxID=3848 RepID=A0A0B2SK69_GLYSO|nr:hypothetical protein glysoja_043061 [Glycine soja]
MHNIPYADDMVRVSVVTVYDADTRVPFLTLEIQYVREVINTFIGWPTYLVKPISDDSHNNVLKLVGRVERCNTGVGEDPLGELMKILYEVYQKSVQLPWDETKFGLPNLWMMFMDDWGTSKGHGSVYSFLEPQSIHNVKDGRQQCQHYIETWVTESQ